MSDPVNKPSHYNAGDVETIDGIRAALGEGFADYCKGNVLKYVWRCGLKGDGVEDLRKARKYLEWAIEAMESNCPAIPDSSSSKPLAIPSGWRELEPDEVPKATDMLEWIGGWFFRNDDATHEYKWHSSRNIRKIETDEPKPLEIPEGWRELKPDEFPKVTDLYENEGAWRNRIDNSSFLYALYEVRHVRKIEAAKGPEYREPTKADIVHGPIEVEACTPNPDTGERLWRKRNLVAIHKHNPQFGVEHPDNASEIVNYMEARIKIETANTSENPKSSAWIPKVGDKVRVVCATPFPKEDRFGIVVKDNVRPREDLFLVKTSNGIFSWFYTSELHLIEAAS